MFVITKIESIYQFVEFIIKKVIKFKIDLRLL